MKIPPMLVVVSVVIGSATTLLAQSQFDGRWETKQSRSTGKHSITVNIKSENGTITGSMVLINPDGSEMEWPIENASMDGKTILFRTEDNKANLDWQIETQRPKPCVLAR
jgi:hypothetical protein